MRFNFEYDREDQINFWIAPDNPVAIPEVVVTSRGRPVGVFRANMTDGTIRDFGFHSTGECRFVLGDEQIPGIAGYDNLEGREKDTNVLVFRRVRGAGIVPGRLLLVQTGIRTDTALEALLHRHFSYVCLGLHRLSEEIISSTLRCPVASGLASGTILVPPYQAELANEAVTSAILLSDPHVEMATRMVWLRSQAAVAADPARNWRLGKLLEAVRFAEAFDYGDVKQVRRFFHTMPEAAYHFLYNPLTQQLATSRPDEKVFPPHSLIAVDLLARFDLVGHKSAYEAFMLSVIDRFGIDEPALAPPPISDAVAGLAERLRKVKEAGEMVVFDRALSDAVLSSVEKSWSA